MPYRIVGVVEDVNPLLSQTYANFTSLISMKTLKAIIGAAQSLGFF